MTKFYCQDTFSGLLNYAALGLPPSSFMGHLLLGDLPRAYASAHKLLVTSQMGGYGEQDVVKNMMELVEDRFPPIVRSTAVRIQEWVAHSGYSKASNDKKTMFILFADQSMINRIERIIRQYAKA